MKYTKFSSKAIPVRTENIDTDQIIPARFLKTTKRDGLGEFLFFNWRYDEHGHTLSDSIFANPKYKDTHILIAGNNFGCGSSREHAPWALIDYGFKAVISTSFGDIFYNNSLKNNLLPVVVSQDELDMLLLRCENNPDTILEIDLTNQSVKVDSIHISFSIDEFRKTCLLKGVDEMGYMLSFEKKIKEFENNHRIFIQQTYNY